MEKSVTRATDNSQCAEMLHMTNQNLMIPSWPVTMRRRVLPRIERVNWGLSILDVSTASATALARSPNAGLALYSALSALSCAAVIGSDMDHQVTLEHPYSADRQGRLISRIEGAQQLDPDFLQVRFQKAADALFKHQSVLQRLNVTAAELQFLSPWM